jgi:hypothetical protein
MGVPAGALQHDDILPRAARKTEPWPIWGSSCQLVALAESAAGDKRGQKTAQRWWLRWGQASGVNPIPGSWWPQEEPPQPVGRR